MLACFLVHLACIAYVRPDTVWQMLSLSWLPRASDRHPYHLKKSLVRPHRTAHARQLATGAWQCLLCQGVSEAFSDAAESTSASGSCRLELRRNRCCSRVPEKACVAPALVP